MEISLPQEVLHIIQTLNDNGFEAYVVGGCVRDSILGRKPYDWDITTNALPDAVKSLFNKTIDTGLKHGTISVMLNNKLFEVTTYRIDGYYADNRRPESVEFTSSINNDLSRRDFTINSIAFHPKEGFVDPFGGIDDINSSIIRTVGIPDMRFQEDALRLLRAIRFSAQLDFTIDIFTFDSIKKNSSRILNVSFERINEELTKILLSKNTNKFLLLRETGLLQYILPEFDACFNVTQNNPLHVFDVANHSLKTVSSVEADKVLRWAALLHDTGKVLTKTTDSLGIDHFYHHPHISVNLADTALRRLKFDNKTICFVCRLIQHHDRDIKADERSVRKTAFFTGDDIFPDLLKLKEADIKGQNTEFLKERLQKLGIINKIYLDIKLKNHCLSVKDLSVNGNDLINLGFPIGKEIGYTLSWLLNKVLDNPELNNFDVLIKLAKVKLDCL